MPTLTSIGGRGAVGRGHRAKLRPVAPFPTSGSGTFLVPAYATSLVIEAWGGGGGGGGSGDGHIYAQATSGTATTFGPLNAGAGTNGANSFVGGSSLRGLGGSASGGDINLTGDPGDAVNGSTNPSELTNGGDAAGLAYGGGVGGYRNGGVGAHAGGGSDGGFPGAGGGPGDHYPNAQVTFGGGGAGYSSKTYTPGQITIDSPISYSIGVGGTGALSGNTFDCGGDGGDGMIRMTVDGVVATVVYLE